MNYAILIVLAIIVVILGLMLYAKMNPKSAVAKDVQRAEADATREWYYMEPRVAAGVKTFVTDAEALAAGFKRIEPALQTELQSILTAAEKRLTDLTAENAKIVEHLAGIEAAKADKALKIALVQTHVETMQAHIAAMQSGS